MMENTDDEVSKTPMATPAEGSFPQADSGTNSGGHHKIMPLKRADGEPLTREDIQFDLLHRIFQDPNAIFRDPYSDVNSPGTTSRVTFCKLYINCILNSPKCTKVARDKMIETPSYAVEFAKLCLLVNVGRINTTLAFYHEMRTVLRTYHPVPSLMTSSISERNMMDAPRMKACLKACLLPSEKSRPPSTLSDILKIAADGRVPPTNVVNLIFVLANQANITSQTHFDPSVDFLDLFVPINIPSHRRAQAFLWLMYHYLESSTGKNPFDDPSSASNPGKVPKLGRVIKDQSNLENIDTEEEREFASRMKLQRLQFLKQLATQDEAAKKAEEQRMPDRKRRFSGESSSASLRAQASPQVQQQQQQPPPPPSPTASPSSAFHQPGSRYSPVHDQYLQYRPSSPKLQSGEATLQHQMPNTSSPTRYTNPPQMPAPHPPQSSVYQPHLPLAPPPRASTRYADAPQRFSLRGGPDRAGSPSSEPNQSSVQYTWSTTWNIDPLADSDEEVPDERKKADYERRLWVMNRLRGKELTPNGTAPRDIGSPGGSAAGGRSMYHINGTVMG